MPISSPWRDIDVPAVDVWTMYMEHQARDYPDDHVLFVDCDDARRAWTFAQLRAASVAFGQGLRHALGWAKGDVLAVYAPNDVDTPVVNLGLHWAGGVATPANPTYTVGELARQLVDSGAKALATTHALLGAAREAAHQAGLGLDRVLLLGVARDPSGAHRHWTDLTAAGAPVPPAKAPIDPACDLAFLVYSSGTTGLPKGVMLTHRNIVANSLQTLKADVRSLSWDLDRQLGILPFFHIYGLSVVINATFTSGAPCIVVPKFDLDKACRLVQQHSVTFLYVPPPIILLLSRHPVVDRYDLSSIRFINSGAAPLSRELVVDVWKRLKIGVKQGYGLSETSPVASSQLADEWWRFQGSIGRLMPGMQAKVVDPEGRELPRGEAFELLLKGPNVFRGYWRKPELNKETFTDDGWYRTGDVVYACPKGHFYVTDRLKELIKYNKLLGHQDVADVGVVGVWDPERHTEIPRAYIVARPGIDPDDALAHSIASWLAERVAPPKRLRGGVRFVDEIPKSQAGKILRRVLRDQAKAEQKKELQPKL